MSEAYVFPSPHDILGEEGRNFGPTDWFTVDQQRIDDFAEVTGDHQWIHVDPERAAQGPFGKTIAHGYLTMSLTNHFLPQLIDVQGFAHGLNIGSDRVRFVTPVPVNSRIRARGELLKAEKIKGAIQTIVRVTIETERGERPACVIDTINRYYSE